MFCSNLITTIRMDNATQHNSVDNSSFRWEWVTHQPKSIVQCLMVNVVLVHGPENTSWCCEALVLTVRFTVSEWLSFSLNGLFQLHSRWQFYFIENILCWENWNVTFATWSCCSNACCAVVNLSAFTSECVKRRETGLSCCMFTYLVWPRSHCTSVELSDEK